jgi:hypothetical protein
MRDVPGVPCRNYRPRPAVPKGDVRLIPLGDGFYAYVDAADYEWLSQWRWHMNGGYAARMEKGKRVYMHRQIMQPAQEKLVDHIDSNRANNCRSNLRVCNHLENQRNKRKENGSASRFKGVFYDKRYDKWRARCRCGGERRTFGCFDNELDAARAYDRAAVQWFGEFARLNFPEEWPPERRAQVYAQRQEPEADKEGKKVGRKEGKSRPVGKKRGKTKPTNAEGKRETSRRPPRPQRKNSP